MESQVRALWRYSPSSYDGRVTLLRARGQSLFRSLDYERGWGQLAKGGVDVRIIAGSHRTILEQPHVQTLSVQLDQCIKKALMRKKEGNSDH
jgi:thioesterase domain-containing protein